MNDSFSAGYRERPHTADWELEVWAPDFPGLLAKAAEGMYALMGMHPDDACLEERFMELEAPDQEGLLVAFLNELLYLSEDGAQICRPSRIKLEGLYLQATLLCAGVSSRNKEIKAVTWHKLEIQKEGDLYRTVVVFDV